MQLKRKSVSVRFPVEGHLCSEMIKFSLKFDLNDVFIQAVENVKMKAVYCFYLLVPVGLLYLSELQMVD